MGSTGLMNRMSGISRTDASRFFVPFDCTNDCKSLSQKFVKMSFRIASRVRSQASNGPGRERFCASRSARSKATQHIKRECRNSRAATNLPYALIGPLPVLSQPLQYPLNFLPPGIGHWVPVLVRQIDGIHHFAINIQLQLLVGRITDTHGPRMFEPLQMIKRPLIELLPAVNPVHHL